jgi:hypothetical protein
MIDWGFDIDPRLPFFWGVGPGGEGGGVVAIYPSIALLCVYSYITYTSQQRFFTASITILPWSCSISISSFLRPYPFLSPDNSELSSLMR